MKRLTWDKSLFTIEDKSGKINLFSLALPHFLDLFLINALGVISMIVINLISSDSAVGVDGANRVIAIITSISNLPNIGATILMSIYMGKGDKETVKKIYFINFITTIVICSALSAIFAIFARPILILTNLSGVKLSQSVTYARIKVPFIVLSSLATCMTSTMRVHGNSKPTLYAGILSAIVSTSLSLLAITKFNLFSTPIIGVSFAGVFGFLTMFLIAFVCWKKQGLKMTKKYEFTLFRKIFKVGVPGSISNISYSLSQLITTSFIHNLSDSAQNAKIYVSSLVFAIYLLGYSIGNANSIMVGRRSGAGELEKADKMHKQNAVICIMANFILSILFLIFYKPLFSIFSPNNETLKIIQTILIIDVFVEFGRALNHVGEFGLNGVGDVYATTIISISSCWGISVFLSYIFGIVLGYGLLGIWIAFACDEILRGTLYLIRWLSGRWKKKFINNTI